MLYFSDDKQDEFIANLFKFKRDGTYLDIGSCSSVGSNNSYFFESLGWKGICIEQNPMFNDSYKDRTCKYINADARYVDYEKLVSEKELPQVVDYLSLDVDEASTSVLRAVLSAGLRFKSITIEHDGHVYGDTYRGPQRELLKANGYHLLCSNVLNQSGRNIGQEHGWEDWWVYPMYFEPSVIEKMTCESLNTEQIMKKFQQ